MATKGILIDREMARAAVTGGKFFGGGGGGSAEKGLEMAYKALELGELRLVDLAELKDEDPIVTSSLVGAPAARDKMVTYQDSIEVYELYKQITGEEPAGVITNENGGMATINGWVLSAVSGIPIIDAPCNGRAHPTATMGSMGLSKNKDYRTWQVAAGGNPDLNLDLKISIYGSLASTSRMIRRAAVEAGGLVTVIRNRVRADYLRDHAAVGGISQAIEVGKILLENSENSKEIINSLSKYLPVEVIDQGLIKDFVLETRDGFDVGRFYVEGQNKIEVTFWNEYMTCENNDQRLATFPELITILSADKGEVLTSAELKEGEEVLLLKVYNEGLKLGAGMFDKELFKEVEAVINKELISYHF
jgi:hypothetical protein